MITSTHSHVEVLDAVDLLRVVVGVGDSIQAHPTHGTTETGRVVGATEGSQNLAEGESIL